MAPDLALAVTTGLLGGFGHCAGMCGPLVASMGVTAARGGARRALAGQLLYNAGRVTTYASLGALMGLTGSFVNTAGRMAGLQNVISALAGAVMVAMGLGAAGFVPAARRLEDRVAGRLFRGVRALLEGGGTGRYYVLGLSFGFLPWAPSRHSSWSAPARRSSRCACAASCTGWAGWPSCWWASSSWRADWGSMLRCEHCLLPFPEREAVHVGDRVFCCTGCRGVYQLISGEGLGSCYLGRRWDEPGLAADPARPVDASAFREAVRSVEGGLAELDVYIDGIRCASCVWLNERLLARLPGVTSARVNYATHRARVRFDPAAAPLEAVLSRIRAGGYEPKPYSESERQRAQDAETKDLLVRLGTAFFLASQLMIYSAALYAGYFQGMPPGLRRAMEVISLGLTLPVFFYAGAPFLRSAWRGLRARRFNMDSLIVLGSGAALLYSVHQMTRGGEVYFDTAAMIVTLVLAGRYVEARA